MPTRLLIVDALSLQIAWFTAALYQDLATPWICLVVFLRILLCGNRWLTLKPALAVMMTGIALELLMIISGLSRYNSDFFLPLWLPLLWLLFGMTPKYSLNWLSKAPLYLQSLLGAVFGTLTYQSAAAFNVLDLQHSTLFSIINLAILWSVALPLMFAIHTRIAQRVIQ